MPSLHRLPAERSTYRDPATGATVTRWTDGPGKNQHLYFTTPSVTADGRWLVFLSDRDGHPNLYAIDRADAGIRRVSDNSRGLLRSYVYPQGGLTGLSKASPCLDEVRNRLYHIRNDTVYRLDLDGDDGEQRVCALPAGWYGAYPDVSPDGSTLVIPVTDPRAFAHEKTQWEQLRTVPARMRDQHLVTRVYLVDVATGATKIAAELPFWASHVQFDPAGTGRILANLEGHDHTGRPLPRRIWCLEPDGRYRPLDDEPPGEWRSHENWARDGRAIVYHGARDGRAFVAARAWDGALLHETSIDGAAYWHATGAVDGRRLFVDRHDGMIGLLDPDTGRMVDLCRHDTRYDDQDTHAHPSTTPDGRGLVFTSDRPATHPAGTCQVYEVPVPTGPR